jgi:aminoglycoside 3-N-acetyltransferase
VVIKHMRGADMQERATITQAHVIEQLYELGVQPGGVLLVHCAFSHVKPLEGGPQGLIAALLAALGPQGTLVMPSMPDDDAQPFDVRHTPCQDMGIVAHEFWQISGVLRCDSPHSFAAVGPLAAQITMPQPIDIPHGLDSPVGRVYELDGQVLLVGVNHDADTTVHLGELLGGARYRCRKSVPVFVAGRLAHVEYGELDHCCRKFRLVDGWLDAAGLQQRGQVGHAEARLARSREIVRVVVEQVRRDETVFLHPYGVDEECDEAHASLAALDKPANGS